MRLNYLVKKIIDLNLIPCSIKWRKSVSGIGRMYANILMMIQENYGSEGIKRLNEVMFKIGFNQADEILDSMGLDRNLKGCIYTLLVMHRIFGIESKIIQKDDYKAIVHISSCYWKNKEGWSVKSCASIERYETGLVKKILPDAAHYYTKRRSLGHDICELVIERNASQC